MEVDKKQRKYTVKGGKTILGRLFQYQERTGMSVNEILKLPYIMFVIGMADAPSIDYDTEEKQKTSEPKTQEEEINAFLTAFK